VCGWVVPLFLDGTTSNTTWADGGTREIIRCGTGDTGKHHRSWSEIYPRSFFSHHTREPAQQQSDTLFCLTGTFPFSLERGP
jgi:hypothetical protein